MEFEFRLTPLGEIRENDNCKHMYDMIYNDNFRTKLITGCPGSGKTTVSIHRLVRLNSKETPVRLVTFQNMLTLAIKGLAHTQQVPSHLVSTFHAWYRETTGQGIDFDQPPTAAEVRQILAAHIPTRNPGELIVDEGQDMPECVFAALPQFYTRVLVGGDDGQRVHKKGARTEGIRKQLLAQDPELKDLSLGRNYRNTYETYKFARQFIPLTNRNAWDENILDRLDHDKRHGDLPIVVEYHDEAERNKHLRLILDPSNAPGNVAILCPLGPWPTHPGRSGESVDEVHKLVSDMGIEASKYHYGPDVPVPTALKKYVVTTFISAKGMEFDVVVIPRVNFFKQIPEEWYVACTRARRQLVIYRDMQHPQRDPIANFAPDTYEHQTAEPTSAARPATQHPF